ncbi:PDZ domain-containing protein [Nephila pilipes]|uniref:PDZ domain-containing protein n=1 Tax=Nephila pilipes TaxID=299642 RepID=A0A8X6T7D9_NEPPI|nr:PDZ domain-containing protein [Nephila pilipes]
MRGRRRPFVAVDQRLVYVTKHALSRSVELGKMRLHIAWIVWSALAGGAAAQEQPCYPPGGVAGIVIATIVVTCVVGGLGAALTHHYWWIPRHSSGAVRSDQELQPTAFDNPYFRNSQEADDLDKSKTKFLVNNKNSLRSSKSEGKTRKGKNPFTFKKQKAMDDSCISPAEPERTVVSLRGHDFTGLGFNIMGNMRDGILVKDVLHRGPASESGLIKAGDKIVSVTVSFSSIVYEDALTILSYASPYDVRLEIERMAPSSSGGPRRLGSCSFSHNGQKLFHPLYRSQSIDDLTQIDREGRSQNDGSGTQGQHRLTTEALSTTGSLNEKMLANVMAEGHWKKKFEDTFESDNVPQAKLRDSDDRSAEQRQETLNADIEEVPKRTTGTWKGSDEESLSSPREDIPLPQNLLSRNRLILAEDDNNDSDVSKDSLELSVKAYHKRNALRGSPVTIPKSQYAFFNKAQIENPTNRAERTYDHTCKSPTDHEGKQLERAPYYSRTVADGVTEKVDSSRTLEDTYRSIPKPFQGERQKLNNCDASIQSYGSRTSVHNGGMDRQSELDDKKFSKTPAAGMFTQINPFQMSSSKQRHFRPWSAREDLSKPPVRLASGPKFTLRDSPMQNRQF